MIYLETTINDGNHNILRTGNTSFPSLEHIGIGTHLGTCDMTIVVVMPLVIEQWVVERHGRSSLGCLSHCCWRNLKETLTAYGFVNRYALGISHTLCRTEQVAGLCQFHT